MFDFIKGTVIEVALDSIILDVNGIGYRLFIPTYQQSDIPTKGESVILYTTLVIKEDSHKIHGFLNKKQRDLFEVLISASGVGPKMAMALLSCFSLSKLTSAIVNGDFTTLCKVPGVGKKTAERVVLELKDKLIKLEAKFLTQGDEPQKTQIIDDALSALLNLGFSRPLAERALERVMKESSSNQWDLVDLIGAALKGN